MSIAVSTQLICFSVLSLVVIIGALGVVLLENIVYSAFLLCGVFLSIAGLYLLLNASFVAAAQVLVYVGAVNVLIIFAIMLVNKKEDFKPIENLNSRRIISTSICVTLLSLLIRVDISKVWVLASPNSAIVEESTYIGAGPNYGKTFAEIYPDTNLKFYKRLSLVPCDTVNGQGRVWGSFTDYSGTTMYANNQSVLKHTIPFKYDDIGATYLPVVRYNKITTDPSGAGTGNPNFQIGNIFSVECM